MGISTIGGTSQSPWSNNPQTLPRWRGAPSIKTAADTVVDLATAGSMTSMALLGATAAITQADTYVTIANVTGGGFMFNAVSPADDAVHTPTFRITVDGKQYVMAASDSIGSGQRIVLGPAINAGAFETTATTLDTNNALGPGLFNTKGFIARDGGAYVPTALLIPSEDDIFCFNLARIRFESSLLVEMKTTGIHATADPFNYGIVTYRLDL